MGQFEYTVPLSSVKPQDIERVAKEYRERNNMGLVPVEDKVIVKPIIETEKTTASGFVLTGLQEEKPTEGIVVAVGPGLVLGNGNVIVPDVNIGEKVVFAKYQGTEVEHDGEKYLILAYRDILAVIG